MDQKPVVAPWGDYQDRWSGHANFMLPATATTLPNQPEMEMLLCNFESYTGNWIEWLFERSFSKPRENM